MGGWWREGERLGWDGEVRRGEEDLMHCLRWISGLVLLWGECWLQVNMWVDALPWWLMADRV